MELQWAVNYDWPGWISKSWQGKVSISDLKFVATTHKAHQLWLQAVENRLVHHHALNRTSVTTPRPKIHYLWYREDAERTGRWSAGREDISFSSLRLHAVRINCRRLIIVFCLSVCLSPLAACNHGIFVELCDYLGNSVASGVWRVRTRCDVWTANVKVRSHRGDKTNWHFALRSSEYVQN